MKVKVKSRGDKRDLLIEVRGDAGEQIDYADVDRLQRAGDALIAPETDRRGDAWVLSYTVPGYVCLRSSSERAVGRPQFERTLRSVLAACRACERERLARRRVLFDPQWVAFNPASGKMRFAYVPLAAAWAPFEVSELLIWLGTHLEAADGAAWELMERTLNYARLSRVLACVDFEAFLIGCGAMASTGATGALGSMVDDDRPRPVEAPAPRGFDFVRLASQVGADDVSRAGRDAGGARSGADARGARVGSSGRGVSGARSGTSSCGTHGACVGASGYGSREARAARAGAPVREVPASPRGASTAPGAGAGSSPSTARDTSYAPMGASASAGALRESGSSGPSFSSAPASRPPRFSRWWCGASPRASAGALPAASTAWGARRIARSRSRATAP